MQEENQNSHEQQPGPGPIQLTEIAPLPASASIAETRRDYGYGQGTPPEGRQLHLRDYWRMVRRRLWIPVSMVFVAVTLMTIYMVRSPSIYEGETTIQIDNEENSAFNFKDLRIINEDALYLNTQLKNLQSPTIAYLVAKTLDLEHNERFFPEDRARAQGKPQSLQVTSGERETQAEMQRLEPYIDALLDGVTVTRLRETRLVQIKYRHPDKDLARKIADTWAEAFIKNNLDARRAGSNDSDQFLDDRIAKVKLELKTAEEKLLNYRRTNQVIDFGQEQNTVITRLADLSKLLLQAETERKNLQGTYDLMQQPIDPSTIPEIQRDTFVQELNRKLTDLKQQREKLLVEYTPEWPAVKEVDQQVAQLEGERRAAYLRIISGIQNQYRAAVRREESLRQSLAEQKGETLHHNEGTITARILQAEVDSNRKLLDTLNQSKKETEVTAASLKSNIRITNFSALPRVPVAPKRVRYILLSFALSLILGVALAIFLDYVNNKIETVEDVDRYLQLPALGVIPAFAGSKARKLLGAAPQGSLTPSAARINGSLPGSANGAVLLTQVGVTSSLAESYRQLRTAVLLSAAEHAPRTMLVTSSQPTEGKTTTSVNLAISLAQTGASVLLVDADLRRPRIHKVFNLKNTRGACNYLAGDSELASLVQTAMPNLYLLPAGPLPPNPAELLGSQRMRQMVETLSANFDYVVIDSPPVASFADGLILSSLVEGVILVVKAGVTPREMAQRTKANLQSVGAKILGVVVNHIKLQPHDYYYYSTYYSRYYYNRDGEDNAHDDPETSRAEEAEGEVSS